MQCCKAVILQLKINKLKKNTGVCCHFLLQGIVPTQRSNTSLLHLLHWQVDSLTLHNLGSPDESQKKERCVHVCVCVCVCVSTQLCLTLCDLMNCDLPGSSVHGISQARILKWVAISYSRGSSQPRDQTCVAYICMGTWVPIGTEPPG